MGKKDRGAFAALAREVRLLREHAENWPAGWRQRRETGVQDTSLLREVQRREAISHPALIASFQGLPVSGCACSAKGITVGRRP